MEKIFLRAALTLAAIPALSSPLSAQTKAPPLPSPSMTGPSMSAPTLPTQPLPPTTTTTQPSAPLPGVTVPAPVPALPTPPALPSVPVATVAPPKVSDMDTVADVVAGIPQLAMLSRAIRTAGLTQQLEELGPFTLIAPTDAAFARLKKEDLDKLMADPAALNERLRLHIVPGFLHPIEMAKQLKAKGGKARFPTLSGTDTLIVELLPTGYLQFSDTHGSLGKITIAETNAFNGLVIPVDLFAALPERPVVKGKKRK